ncbi:MAG: DNA-3-methyladenine glycosylase 2 family protein [Myxococcaceae bacterium]|nr:DNA-3-methyladenine glycosylase 2 family protein [Myxococcaceae bacterium]
MVLDPDTCYRALKSRDVRFDGRFFTAVKTTGIYCRPICPAKTPLRRNVTFFACAAAAEEAGFRPCRRCRPDAAPRTPTWMGASATVSRALRLIEEGALDGGSVEALAERVGVGSRQLHRLFTEHLGTSPVRIARSHRAHFARALLDATDWPVAKVAHEAGFGSVRRFNEVIRAAFGAPPTELRRERARTAGLTLRLALRPPYDWDALLSFLAPRAIPGVEHIDAGVYRRTFDGGWLQVRPDEGHALVLTVTPTRPLRGELMAITRRIRRMFDLNADPLAIAAVLSADPLLAPSVRARPGLRVPGAWDPFETCVRAILGQQVSVRAATTLSGRLVERFGTQIDGGPLGLTHHFPTPAKLERAAIESIGVPRARAECIRAIARAAGTLSEPAGSLDALIARLTALPGIGPWTAHYLAMRVFREPDAFPSGDLVLRKAAQTSTPRALEARAESWRPWRAYAAMHLWAPFTQPESNHDRALAR